MRLLVYKYLVDRYIWQGGRKRLAWFGVELAQFSRAEIRIPTNLLLRSTASAHHQHSSLKNTLNIEQYDCVQKDSQPITYHGSGVTKRERTSERCKFSENILGFIWALKKKKKKQQQRAYFLMHGQINKSNLKIPWYHVQNYNKQRCGGS